MTEKGGAGHQERVELCASPPGIVSPEAAERTLDFATIYGRYFDFAWRTLRRLGVPPAQLDDGVQDVFVVVHRRLKDFEGRSSIKTWLASICWRVASDHRRAASRRGDLRPLSDDLAAGGPDPQQAAAEAEALRQVERLLRRLDHHKRAVFVLTEMEGMSAPEIADALGIKLNTVYSRLRAARRAFEAALVDARREGSSER